MFEKARRLVLSDRAAARKALADEIRKNERDEIDAELDALEADERERQAAEEAEALRAQRAAQAREELNAIKAKQHAAALSYDAVPNAEKRRWDLLSKSLGNVTEGNLEMLAAALLDAARRRLDEMVSAVQGAEALLTRDQARAAVLETDVGSTLQELVEMAERAGTEASSLSKSIDASLAKKADERRLMDRAKELQVEKAREGRPVSLLQAIEIAKAAG